MKHLLLLWCVVWVSFLSGCTNTQSTPVVAPASDSIQKQAMPRVCYQKTCWDVEIADDPEEQKQWLMNRTELAQDQGMLFVFPKTAAWPFWMKDTLIPLDMIWLDGTGTVVYLHRWARPCSEGDACPWYWPKDPLARYVLELNAGQADINGISLGAKLTLPVK